MKIYLTIVCLCIIIDASGQIITDYDSIPVSKSRVAKYRIEIPSMIEISAISRNPKALTKVPTNFFEGAFTLFTGITTTTSDETFWVSESELKTSDGSDWAVPFFFHGELSKTRNRERDDDGDLTLVTEKVLEVDWNENGFGLILENNDTIGEFESTIHFKTDEDDSQWLLMIFAEGAFVRNKIKKFGANHTGKDFKVSGILKGRHFSVITSSSSFRCLILIENIPVAVFQGDPNFIIIGRRNKINPYLLLDNALNDTEKNDMFRLAMLSRLISSIISVDFYEM